MDRVEKIIYDNKIKLEFIRDLIDNYSFELDGGYWRAVLEGKLDGIQKILDALDKEKNND